MKYNLSIPIQAEQAKTRLEHLISKGATVEITQKRLKRSYSQNNYLHLVLAWFAWEYGETKEYVKQEYFKRKVNPDLFLTEYANRKTGEIREALRSSADLNSKEMTMAIQRFRNFAVKEAGIYLPEPSDLAGIQELDNQVSKIDKTYL